MPVSEVALWIATSTAVLGLLGMVWRKLQDLANRFDAIGPNGERITQLENGQAEMREDIAEIKRAIVPEHGQTLAANDAAIRTELASLSSKLDAHTLQDSANFGALEGKLDLLLRRDDRRPTGEDS